MTDALRSHLARLLEWDEAHASFEKSIDGIPADTRGTRPTGFGHSVWELLEHMRLAQKDLLDFCVNANYVHALKWPDDYWPSTPGPSSDEAWTRSIADFTSDREKVKEVVRDTRLDLFALVPTGKGHQTYLRAILLIADHNSYHLGQILAVRKALGIWQ
jgi:uncharacterized damage-inducible protein DinB